MADAPLFSIVIASHGRAGPLTACLRAIRASDLPDGQFELVAVDDGTPSRLDEAVQSGVGRYGVRWVRLPENVGPAAARNEGVRVARGKYIAFIDDDCLADRAWLSRLKDALESNPGAAVGGRIVDGGGGNLYCAADQAILDAVYGYYNPDPARARFFVTANLAVPADAFRDVGGFDPAYRTSEDRDFCARWLESGRRLIHAADAVVTHAATSSLRRFWDRHFAFGIGAYRFRARHARTADERIRLEPTRFYRSLVLAPFRGRLRARAFPLAGLIALSQAASACGFIAARRRN
jgi:GT2 family glycosyltransferase